MTNPQQDRDEDCVKLLRHFFVKFCEAEQIPENMTGHVLPVYFLGWLDTQWNLYDCATECETVGVSFTVWEYLREHILGNAAGVERISAIWPFVTLGSRPAPTHALKSVTWNMLLEWADGSLLPVQVHVSRELVGGPGLNDATVGHILASRAKVFMETIVDQGLDALHGQAVNYGGEQPFNVLMGMMLQVISGKFFMLEGAEGAPKQVQIKPELIPYLKDYMRLCQAMIQPQLPPEVKAEIRRRLQQSTGKQAAQGGWDA